MLELNSQTQALLDAGATLLTPSRQRATAVRLAYAAAALRAGRRVWHSPDVLPWSGWLERQWLRAPRPAPRLLRPAEEWLLWREVASDTARELELLLQDSIPEGLRRAAALMYEWEIAPAQLRTASGGESELLARALRAFAGRCADLGVMPAGELAARMAADPPLTRAVHFGGFAPLSASQRRLAEALGRRGVEAAALTAGEERARVFTATALDPDHELDLVADWARRRLTEEPSRRLLVVVPDLPERGAQLARLLRAELAPAQLLDFATSEETPAFAVEGGQPLALYAPIAHALDSLALCSGPLEFERVSAWLRAPFWDVPTADARARLDLWLRARARTELDARQLMAQLRTADAAAAPGSAQLRELLGLALDALAGGPAAPRSWAERFLAALDGLRWPGLGALRSADQQLRVRFIELLREFGEVGPAAGNLDGPGALALLRDLALRIPFEPATGDAPVTVTGSLGDPLVGYDGIWVVGLQAERWPAPVRPDPLVPLALQRAAGIPQASAAGQLAQARLALGEWRRRSAELVLSYAHRVDDAHGVPSPLLAQTGAPAFEPVARIRPLAARLRSEHAREEFADERAPPWPLELPLPSGTRTLELQNLCAFRAFAELRLGAVPLEAPEPGIDARTRGMLLHRALDKLWQRLGGSDGLAARPAAALEPLIAECVREAAVELLEGAPGEPDARLGEREIRRDLRLIAELCELERGRAPFAVLATERSRSVTVQGATLNVRLDRLDALADGSLVIIDYKSGRATTQHWHEEPVSHPQLLAYLLALEEEAGEVAALATAHVARAGAEFRGVAARDDILPKVREAARGRSGETPPPWSARLERWRGIARRLVGDFTAGVAAVEPATRACEVCHLQALCRIADQQRSAEDDVTEEEP